MAHSCPECGQSCYCGSDIDDCLFDFDDDIEGCTHYLRRECDGHEVDDDCMDCGMCNSCIERSRAYAEEMEREQENSNASR